MLPVLLGAVVVNYLFSRAIRGGNKKKLLLVFIVCIDALMLVEFKILGQVIDNSLMPLGVSFFVFKMISFQADTYMDKITEEPPFADVAAYFCMFPQIVSGPIMRFSDYVENDHIGKDAYKAELKTILSNIEDGLRFFVIGLFMKVMIADHLSMLWNDIGTIGYESLSTPLAWIGAATYSMQLYYDFWGYSLMAAGVGVMLGFPFVVNFDQPYSAKGVSDFYRRWHATLGSWFRDYIYIPLGGSRVKAPRIILNLLIVWLITGFWHGITLNYILWGLILFVIIVSERFIVFKLLPKWLGVIVGRLHVFVLIPLTWVVFAIPGLNMLREYFCRLFPFFGEGIAVNAGDYIKKLGTYGVFLGLGLILLIPGIYGLFEKYRKKPVIMAILFVIFWICVFSLSNSAGNPFMYFKF
ncbi:MBOAT family O-acyltransferase [Butyrivibrio sp. INlla21]|uniref:MBOAT family O-acyltransferase n=1 Tax=Butyrivibrio sp. INlla21 TaxID=1520811 RepID=UPI001FA843FA|nr:MBOAT family O-acyltransferase [Butyrivibrio sp. INlla21]